MSVDFPFLLCRSITLMHYTKLNETFQSFVNRRLSYRCIINRMQQSNYSELLKNFLTRALLPIRHLIHNSNHRWIDCMKDILPDFATDCINLMLMNAWDKKTQILIHTDRNKKCEFIRKASNPLLCRKKRNLRFFSDSL